MKKTTPMQLRKATAPSSRGMEAYAAKRTAPKAAAKSDAKAAPAKKGENKVATSKKASAPTPALAGGVTGRDNYDAQYDLDTLTRAEAIKADGKRHSAAMNEAKKKQAALKNVMGGS